MTAAQRRQLAEDVRRAIAKSGMSAYAIAKSSGVAKSTITRFVNEQTSLTIESLEKIAGALGLRVVLHGRKK